MAAEFDALLHDGQAPVAATAATATAARCGTGPLPIDSEALLEQAAARSWPTRCGRWAQQPRVLALRDESKLRLGRLMQRAGAGACATAAAPMAAALRFVDWVEPLLRRESYLALLVERPEVQHRLLRLLGLARWPMQYLMRHPGVIDELADERLLHERFDRAAFSADLEGAPRPPGSARARPTRRSLLDTLRHAHHAEVFRTLVRDVEGDLTVEQVADDLSALADAMLDIAAALGLGAPEAAPPRDAAAWPSSPTASSAARSWATAATSTWSSSTTTPTSPTTTARRRSTAPSCAS